MLVSDQPGCWGDAARLPKKPGIQKLTPPSSAAATVGAPMSAPKRRMKRLSLDMLHPPETLCLARRQPNGRARHSPMYFQKKTRVFVACGASVTTYGSTVS